MINKKGQGSRWDKWKRNREFKKKARKKVKDDMAGEPTPGERITGGFRKGMGAPSPGNYMPSFRGRGPSSIGGGSLGKIVGIIAAIISVIVGFLFFGVLVGVIMIVAAVIIMIFVFYGFDKRTIMIAIVFGIAVIGFIIYFNSVGGGQVLSATPYLAEKSIGSIFESFAFRSALNFIQNPFGVSPTTSQVEEVQEGTSQESVAPNQAFSVSLRKMNEMVQFDQKALAFVITVKNEGSSRIQKVNVTIKSEQPKKGCLRFSDDGYPKEGTIDCEKVGNALECTVDDLGPYAQKEITISGVSVSGGCIADSVLDEIKPEVPIPVYVNVYASTYYPTASRLAVERIRTDYGVLLFQNKVLLPQKTGAITRAGSAMTINLDVGDQPILDSVRESGLIMNWMNTGSGHMDENRNPFLFIITPGNFGHCVSKSVGENTVVATSLDVDLSGCKENAKSGAIICTSRFLDGIKSCGASFCGDVDDPCYSNIISGLENKEYDAAVGAWTSFGSGALNEAIGCNEPCCEDADDYDKCMDDYLYEENSCIEHEKDKIMDCYNTADANYENCEIMVSYIQDADTASICNDIELGENADDNVKCILCDDALYMSWCQEGSPVYSQIRRSAPAMQEVFDWVCEKADESGWENDDYHVCATNGIADEFQVFTCPLELCSKRDDDGDCTSWEIATNENRVTQYVTAMSVYPYRTGTSTQIKAFCTEGFCP